MKERLAVLREEPLCRACLAAGRTTASERVDHVVPLAMGGSDDRTNKQGLCIPCHDDKTKSDLVAIAQWKRACGLA